MSVPPAKKRRAPGAGRPKKAPGERVVNITAGVTAAVARRVAEMAEREGRTKAAMAARLVEEALRLREKEEIG